MPGGRSDIAKPQNSSAVSDDSNQIPTAGQLKGLLVVLGDDAARFCNAWSVSQGQILSGLDFLAGNNLDLAA